MVSVRVYMPGTRYYNMRGVDYKRLSNTRRDRITVAILIVESLVRFERCVGTRMEVWF